MKSVLFAAALLLGSALADVHRIKLKKIPLSEQLVGTAVLAHTKVLGCWILILLPPMAFVITE